MSFVLLDQVRKRLFRKEVAKTDIVGMEYFSHYQSSNDKRLSDDDRKYMALP